MTPNLTPIEESYISFLTEAQDLLQKIEQDLLSLKEDRTPFRVHSLMRSAHTLKGAAASIKRNTIKQVAHVLEDIFKALYNPDVTIDAEVEALLFQGYECLRLPLMAEFTGGQVDEPEVLNRVADVIAQLQEKLGDCFDCDAPIPTSAELGFDMVQSMFEGGVEQRLRDLERALTKPGLDIEAELRTKAEVFLGLAESLNLPGFGAIAQTTLAALAAHPDKVFGIAALALKDFSEGQEAILAGDRTQGGSPSPALQELAGIEMIEIDENHSERETPADLAPLEIEVEPLSLNDLFSQVAAETEPGAIAETLAAETELLVPFEGVTAETEFSLKDLLEQVEELESPETSALSTNIHQPPRELFDLVEHPETSVLATPTPSPAAIKLETVASVPGIPVRVDRVEPVRVDVDQLKRLDHLAGELLINQGKQTNQDQQLRLTIQELRSQLQKHQQTLQELQNSLDRLLMGSEGGKIMPPIPMPVVPQPEPSPITLHFSDATTFDALEMDRYSDSQVLIQSALNEAAQLEGITETVNQLSNQAKRTLETQQRLLTHARDDLTAVRMQPLGDLFNRFPRVLQQLAAAHHKKVELHLSGADVLVDKAIAEKLYDPLLHLIRNAFDHGIESPETRQAQGKPEVGQIEIRAYHQGNRTVIEVKDDGQGIDLRRVIQRAIEVNLITAEQAYSMSTAQVLGFLFKPGFSTAAQLSDLSGRGVGLDVVNTQIQAVKGSVAVSSLIRQGTTFYLQMPLSLTITKLLVCQTQGIAYALPIEKVKQVVLPQPEQLTVIGGEQVVLSWRQGQEEFVIPVYSLSDLVEYSATRSQLSLLSDSRSEAGALQTATALLPKLGSATHQAQPSTILLIQTPYGFRGLGVDRVFGEQELVIRSLGTAIAPPSWVYGCCILGNSRLALAVDPEVLLQSKTEVDPVERSSEHPTSSIISVSPKPPLLQALEALPPQQNSFPPSRSVRTVMVIDDSLTLRRTLTTTLKQAGYAILQAEDGMEALTQLQQSPRVDLIICDIEMPRLNGFQFLHQHRQNLALAKIPVVMLTSRSSSKHRQVALGLGAAAYVTKPYDEEELLATLERLLLKQTINQSTES